MTAMLSTSSVITLSIHYCCTLVCATYLSSTSNSLSRLVESTGQRVETEIAKPPFGDGVNRYKSNSLSNWQWPTHSLYGTYKVTSLSTDVSKPKTSTTTFSNDQVNFLETVAVFSIEIMHLFRNNNDNPDHERLKIHILLKPRRMSILIRGLWRIIFLHSMNFAKLHAVVCFL